MEARAGGDSLFRHNLNRGGQVYGSLLMCPNHQGPTATAVAREDCGLRPVEIPTIFDSNHRIRAGAYVGEGKTAIEIGLVPAEKIVIRFRIFRDQDNHRARYAFSVSLGKAIDRGRASRQRE